MTRPPDHVDTDRLETAPRLRRRTPPRGALTARGQRVAAVALAVQVLAILGAGEVQATQPPAAAAAGWQWLGGLLGVLLFGALILAGVQLPSAPGRSLDAGLAAGIVGLAMIVGCPVTGHHELGAWWLGALALIGVAVAAPLIARRRLADSDPGRGVPPGRNQ